MWAVPGSPGKFCKMQESYWQPICKMYLTESIKYQLYHANPAVGHFQVKILGELTPTYSHLMVTWLQVARLKISRIITNTMFPWLVNSFLSPKNLITRSCKGSFMKKALRSKKSYSPFKKGPQQLDCAEGGSVTN